MQAKKLHRNCEPYSWCY